MSVLYAAVRITAGLLHCRVGELLRALSTHKIRAGTEDIVQKLTHSQVFTRICYILFFVDSNKLEEIKLSQFVSDVMMCLSDILI